MFHLRVCFQHFLQNAVVVLVPTVAQVIYYLVSSISGRVVGAPPIIEPFLKNNESVWRPVYCVDHVGANRHCEEQKETWSTFQSVPSPQSPLVGKSSESRIVDLRAAKMYHFHCQPLRRLLRQDLYNCVGVTSSVTVIS